MREEDGPLFQDDDDLYTIEDEIQPQPAAARVEPVTLDYLPAFKAFPSLKEEQLSYLMLTVHTAPVNHQTNRNPLNVCLVLDQSSSMRGEKLFSVKSAAKQVVDQLTINDFFTLVSFNDRATAVVSCQKVTSRETIKAQIDSIEAKGGTELAQGLFRGINEMKPAAQLTELNYLLLLTDGQTYGDADQCVQLGNDAARYRIVIHPMGIGNDWNEDLLETVAARCGGSSEFIESPDQIVRIFMQKINQLRSTLTNNGVLIVEPVPGARLRQVFRVNPNIAELETHSEPGKSAAQVPLGPLGVGSEYKYLLEMVLPPCPPGTYKLATLRFSYVSQETGARQTLDLPVGLTFVESNKPIPVNHEVKAVIEKVTTFKLQARAWQDIAKGDIASGTRRLSAVGTRLLSMGEVDLAVQVQEEVQNLEQRGTTSAQGKKRIKYGTRGLASEDNY